MFKLDSFVLYVANIEASKNFYSEIFECEGQVLSPTFVSFSLDTHITVQLKQLDHVSPSADITGGGTELSLVANKPYAHFTNNGKTKAFNFFKLRLSWCSS